MFKWIKLTIIFAGIVLASLLPWAQWSKLIGAKTNGKGIESAISAHYWVTEFKTNKEKRERDEAGRKQSYDRKDIL